MITSLEEERVAICLLSCFFPALFSILINSLEEERVGLYACSHVFFFFFFSVLFSIMITSLEEDRVGLYASRACVCLSCRCYRRFIFFSSSCCQRLTAACDCGSPCTFH